MTPPPGHDLEGLIAWAGRDPWRERVDAVMAGYFEPAMEASGLSFEGIGDALGGGWSGTLWGCAFEDFLTRRFGAERESPVEEYLRRRGWKERTATRAYMTALAGSVMSLWEVSDVVPGTSLRARDLIRGGEPVLVTERSATRTLRPWDRLAARIVPDGPRHVLAGGVLPFTQDGSERLFFMLRERGPARRRPGQVVADGALHGWRGSDETLRAAAPLFTLAWLLDVLPRALDRTPPRVLNGDGDEVVFHTLRFPLAPGVTPGRASARLDAASPLRGAGHAFWNWIGPSPASRPLDAGGKGIVYGVTLDDGANVLGTVEIADGAVVLEVSSAARAERGRAMIADALGPLAAAPRIEMRTVEEMRAAAPRESVPPSGPAIPLEEAERLVHELLDRQYRATLDEPVPMLGGRTPRAAARSARGRRDLAGWLKHLENSSGRAMAPDDPMATYDFTPLWRELGVEHLRR